jgi:competence protein ComEC
MIQATIQHRSFLFWRKSPALLIGISLLVGSMSLWLSLFWSLYLIFIRKTASICILLGMILYTHLSIPPLKADPMKSGLFQISSMKAHRSPFYDAFIYQGTLYIKDETSIPCSIKSSILYKGDHEYLVSGILTQKNESTYHLLSKTPWIPLHSTWGIPQMQFELKQWIQTFIQTRCSHPKTATLLNSLLTGTIDHQILKYEFGQLGLQHVLAVSGFHFGILIFFFSFILRKFLPQRGMLITLFLIINLYYLLVGPLPGVQRSWLAASGYLLAKLFKRQTNPLNLLGFAMGAELLIHPLIWQNLGFQLSFASTFGILLYAKPFEKMIQTFLPKRTQPEIALLTLPSKHGYLISSYLRKALSLSFSVNLIIIPFLLYHFHAFPIASLIYNLLIPFLLSGSLLLLLLSFSLYPLIHPLGNALFKLTNAFTTEVLHFTTYTPASLDMWIFVQGINGWALAIYLFLTLQIGIFFEQDKKDQLHSLETG